MNNIEAGQIYRHYKGNLYIVICTAKNSETLSDMVIYRDVSSPEKIWARPLSMWNETVEVDEKKVARFTAVGEE